MSFWHSVTDPDILNGNVFFSTACANENSLWFSGHFPGNPILPGIAQLAMIYDVIKRLDGKNGKISGICRVRFKQVIKPGDFLKLIVQTDKEGSGKYSFKIMIKDELACSGKMIVERSE